MNYKYLIAYLFFCCSFSAQASVTIIEVKHTQEVCDLANGTITIFAQGAASVLYYSIDNGATYQTSNFFDGLESKDYVIRVSDGFFCTEKYTVQITDIDTPEIDLSVDCQTGTGNVDIDLIPFDTGRLPFTYSWQGPAGNYSTEDLAGVPPGAYAVTVEDFDGCSVDTSFIVPICCYLDALCTSDTSYYSCPSEYKEITSAAFDTLITNVEKADFLAQHFSIQVLGEPCNDLTVAIVNTLAPSTDCNTPEIIVRSIEISDGVSTRTCEKSYFIENYSGLKLKTPAKDKEVLCEADYLAEFQAFIDSRGGAEFETCSQNITVTTRPEVPDIDFLCRGSGNLLITFIAEDLCGYIDSTKANFIVTDSTSPEINCPSDLNVLGSDSVISDITNWLQTVTATDNCSTPVTTHNFEASILPGDCKGAIIPVDFAAVDECGNVTPCVSTINITGAGGTILCPLPLEIACDEISGTTEIDNWIISASASDDNGSDLQVDSDYVPGQFSDLACGTYAFNFMATGDCIDLSCVSTLTIVDRELPKIICPADIDIDVLDSDFDSNVENWLAEVTGTDNCQIASIDHDLEIDFNLDCGESRELPVHFTIVDNCNNAAVCRSLLTLIAPASLPTIVCPENLIINCGNDIENEVSLWLNLVTVTGGSAANEIENDLLGAGLESLECGGIIDVVFQVNSDCGNTACAATISYNDDEAPVMLCEEYKEIVIKDSLDRAELDKWLESIEATDNCSEVFVQHDLDYDLSKVICSEDMEIVFRTIDACDNITTCKSTLSISQENNLSLICPDSIAMGCKELNIDSLDYQILMELAISSDVPYELEYDYEIEVYDISCDYIYNYSTTVTVIDTCLNFIDCRIDIEITPEPEVYIPNVFSPDVSGQRIFTVYANEIIEEVEEFYIYDKWGELVYEAFEFEPNMESVGWDGRYKNANDDGAVYVYHAVVRSIDGEKYKYSGDLTLLR